MQKISGLEPSTSFSVGEHSTLMSPKLASLKTQTRNDSLLAKKYVVKSFVAAA